VSQQRAYADLREPTPILARVPRRSAPWWTRPLGYGLMTVVWLALFLATTAITVLALPAAMASTLDGGPLTDAPMFARADWLPTVIVIALVAAPVLGVITLLLAAATVGIALSAATLFVRSLRPRYRDERLSLSAWTRGETVGPASTAVTGATMSLVPIRMTRWSKAVTIVRFNGWIPNLNLLLLGVVWGLGYVGTVAWMLWPARGAAAVLCAIGSLLVAAGLLAIAWARRRHFARVMPASWARSRYAQSWPSRREEPTSPGP
jgi:hypothetical protein